MKKKQIGIVATQLGNDRQYVGIPRSYEFFLRKFGDVILIQPDQEINESLDLLVLPGGDDVLSSRYKEAPSVFNTKCNPYLEYFDTEILPQYIQNETPIFGICRGLQTLNVHFGGKLVQQINFFHGYSEPRTELVNELLKLNDSPAIRLKKDQFKVNSLHHQGVSLEYLAEGLEALYISPERDPKDSIVEVLRHTNDKIYAVQYHPEEIFDTVSKQIINHLLKK